MFCRGGEVGFVRLPPSRYALRRDLNLRLLFEVATRKRMTGSRLQILLELQRHLLTLKLDAHVDDPWLPTNSRWILPGIMGSQTFRDIGGRSDVSPLAIADTSKDVDESLRSTDHGSIVSKHRARSTALKIAGRSWGTFRGTQN
jgi:hypothetical protein